jgi:hypothetical protein
VSNQGRDLEKFLEQAPWMRKWVHECVSCHHRGYKPELPESEFDNSTAAATSLRRLVDEMVLDEAGLCEQCRQAGGKTKDSSHPSSRFSPSRIACEDRKRLNAAYADALRAKQEVESRLCAQIVSPDPNIKRRAKNELKRAEKHSHRFLLELMAHNKKHGCGS